MSSPEETVDPTDQQVDPDRMDPTDQQMERKITHDEFDPKGTLALIMIYFLIVAGMWAFMYFVEFLGRGPTVV